MKKCECQTIAVLKKMGTNILRDYVLFAKVVKRYN